MYLASSSYIFHRNDNAAIENVSVKELKHILDGDLFKINTPLKIQARKSTETFFRLVFKQ